MKVKKTNWIIFLFIVFTFFLWIRQDAFTKSRGNVNDDLVIVTEICHRPQDNPDRARTITVGREALRAHLAHGDTLGPCDYGLKKIALLFVGHGEPSTAEDGDVPIKMILKLNWWDTEHIAGGYVGG
jgi:hypothetical protein